MRSVLRNIDARQGYVTQPQSRLCRISEEAVTMDVKAGGANKKVEDEAVARMRQ